MAVLADTCNVLPSNVKLLPEVNAAFDVPSLITNDCVNGFVIVLNPAPEVPLVPDEPDEPEVPDEPAAPDVPDEPDEPEVPDEPAAPDVPV